jgi:hypothetical protein
MYLDPYIEALQFDIEQRRRQAAQERRASSCNLRQARPAMGLRWATGNALLRIGTLLMGDEGRLHSNAADGG